MNPGTAFIDGIAFWAPSLPGWTAACAAFRDGMAPALGAASRPSPELLPPAERRRAPDTVALALEVATHAVAGSGHRSEDLLSVFTSAHGDPAITDYLCGVLVAAPLSISPTKFHNSVHNAASGYWGIATGCLQASTAVSGFDASFAAGLLEALAQCSAEQRPVLLVGYDIEAAGLLRAVNDSRGLLAVALVIAPLRSGGSRTALQWSVTGANGGRRGLLSAAAAALQANAMSDALPFFEALARSDTAVLDMPLGERLALRVQLQPAADPG